MVVYWEYAFAENFLLDALLLWLALICTRGKIKLWRLLLASALGAAQAVVFPLLPLNVWAAYAVKFLGGALIAIVAAQGGVKRCALTVAAFFALTFAYGGLLTAAYSFFGVEKAEGNGYLVEQAPVALVLCGAIAFAACAVLGARAFFRYRKLKRSLLPCKVFANGRSVAWLGFADSGNLLSFRGSPVCVTSAAGIFALFGAKPQSAGRITLTTVNGAREAPVFLCERLEAGGREYRNVYFTVGEVPAKHYQTILHSSITGENHDALKPVAHMAEKNGGN